MVVCLFLFSCGGLIKITNKKLFKRNIIHYLSFFFVAPWFCFWLIGLNMVPINTKAICFFFFFIPFAAIVTSDLMLFYYLLTYLHAQISLFIFPGQCFGNLFNTSIVFRYTFHRFTNVYTYYIHFSRETMCIEVQQMRLLILYLFIIIYIWWSV